MKSKTTKKIWEILENEETKNDYYKKNTSILYDGLIDCNGPDEEKTTTILGSLAKQESIVQEFDRDGYDVGNVALVYLSGTPFDWIIEQGGNNNYWTNWLACSERVSRWNKKNKNKAIIDGVCVSLIDDATALVQYTEQTRTTAETVRLEKLQGIENKLQEIKANDRMTARQKKYETKKQQQELYSIIEQQELDGVKFARLSGSNEKKNHRTETVYK